MAKGAKTGGRTKGTPNRVTADLKQAIMKAFGDAGGSDYLAKVASEQPAVFCQLLGKVLPLQLDGDPEKPIRHVFTWQTADTSGKS